MLGSTPCAEDIIATLAAASSTSHLRSILRTIKNTLTGHELRKIEYIQAGLVPVLDNTLAALSDASYASTNQESSHQEDDDLIWSNAASIVSVLANSGPAFTEPILDSFIIKCLLSRLHTEAPAKLRVTILRCLNSIADNRPLESKHDWTPDQRLSRLLYTEDNVHLLANIVGSPDLEGGSLDVEELLLALICKTCYTERQKQRLVGGGMLTLLFRHLAALVGSHESYRNSTLQLTPLLETIALLIEKSKANADQLVDNEQLKHALTMANSHVSGFDQVMPNIPDKDAMTAARRSPFPPLAYTSTSSKKRTTPIRASHDQNAMVVDSDDELDENLIVPWLMYIAHESRGKIRIIAARLLGILKCYGLVHPARIKSFRALLIPILVAMIGTRRNFNSQSTGGEELVPSTLALIVKDNENLQDAAVEASAIPELAAALKLNFESMPDLEASLWWPQKQDRSLTEGRPGCCLGLGGPSKQLRLSMLHREGLLQALASLAPSKDAYRKDICDRGALTQIILALEPAYSSISSGEGGATISVSGNSCETLVAACGAIRALTRSATALRTKLVDADVAKSILRLLQTHEPEVRIAATMVMANLAHDFSPMKESIGEYSVVRKLCEQAHSANARLRLESLFALKALVNNSPNKLKMQVVEELRPDWIRQIIATDPYKVPLGEVIGVSPRDYRNESMARITDVTDDMDIDEQEEDTAYTHRTVEQDLDIQIEMFGLLRNLTTGDHPSQVIEYLLESMGEEDFIQTLTDHLHRRPQRNANLTCAPRAVTIIHVIYIAAHLCVADRRYRSLICHSTILMKQVASLLTDSEEKIRSACCWLVINLVYQTHDTFDAVASRAMDLHGLGIVATIRRLEKQDPVMDVVERAKTASECFSKLLDRS